MIRKFPFSHRHQNLGDIHIWYMDTTEALKTYFDSNQPDSDRFKGFSALELKADLNQRLEEVEMVTVFSLLSAIEAQFRIDYIQRCNKKKKDAVSKEFRAIYKIRGYRVSLEDDIFSVWKIKSNTPPTLLSALKDAFNYRHWIAHGRYYIPNLGRQKYDYPDVYQLVQTVLNSFPFERSDSEKFR